MKLLSAGLLALSLSSCNVCEKEEMILDVGSRTLATVLECANVDPIRSDLKRAFDHMDLCSEQLSANLCSTASGALVRHLKNRIPKTWECTADKSGAVLKHAIERACRNRLGFACVDAWHRL